MQRQCRRYLARHCYCKLRKAAIASQSFWRGRLARRELSNLKQKANGLQEARTKLENEVKELTWRLQVEKRIRAGLEETKNQENAKWQSVLKEMQDQSEQTKELFQKEREAAKKELEEARANKDASSKEIVDKLTAENEKLKEMISSSERKFDEAEKKYEESNKLSEERLKQANEAKSKMAEMKTTFQRLQEKVKHTEIEEQILRQLVMMTPSTSNRLSHFHTRSSQGQSRNLQGGTAGWHVYEEI